MKNILIVLSIGILLITSACEKKCKTYTEYETAPVILEYFGNYKPGNYWIYENQDGTKRDSMWVSDYIEWLYKDPDPCYSFPQRDFFLHSNYLSSTKQNMASIENKGYCCKSGFYIKDSLSRDILGSAATIEQVELDGLRRETNYILNSKNPIIFTKVTFSLKQTSLYEADTILFAENVGIIKFIGINKKDTFFLTKHYIK